MRFVKNSLDKGHLQQEFMLKLKHCKRFTALSFTHNSRVNIANVGEKNVRSAIYTYSAKEAAKRLYFTSWQYTTYLILKKYFR